MLKMCVFIHTLHFGPSVFTEYRMLYLCHYGKYFIQQKYLFASNVSSSVCHAVVCSLPTKSRKRLACDVFDIFNIEQCWSCLKCQ